MPPAFGGKHYFESCINAKSWKNIPLLPSGPTDSGPFGATLCTWNIANPLEKCAFPVYDPSWEALFSINCSIAWILDGIFEFSLPFVIIS